ncbi:FHA/TonB domain protein [Plesiocystis pacifica SIR-1]|uniref:FHA/TonB domain protein n=1 Tax=Plesiocystis pacifica SIR-1 TaxID=391625 RepID=A6GHP7_9BACT|nr:AgmX/PglI C-terminal domain-containing protein [Plesiocystis pacifica]EDM74589.1 FHA/TonB domain protein [Plesiocystis pacifica SIR-1]
MPHLRSSRLRALFGPASALALVGACSSPQAERAPAPAADQEAPAAAQQAVEEEVEDAEDKDAASASRSAAPGGSPAAADVDALAPTEERERKDASGDGFGAVAGVELREIEAGDGLGRDLIRRAAKSNEAELRSCYTAGLTRDPSLRGDVIVELTIDAGGTVGAAKLVDGSLSEGEVGECVRAAIEGWTFPSPEGGASVKVTLPIEFSPGSDGRPSRG